jgi:hypothetical protein
MGRDWRTRDGIGIAAAGSTGNTFLNPRFDLEDALLSGRQAVIEFTYADTYGRWFASRATFEVVKEAAGVRMRLGPIRVTR